MIPDDETNTPEGSRDMPPGPDDPKGPTGEGMKDEQGAEFGMPSGFNAWQAPGGIPDPPRDERPPARAIHEREVKVINVFQYNEDRNDLTFVLLQDGTGRRLPIFIGQAEALAIFIALQRDNKDFHRPLTHDLLKNAVEKLGGKIERLTIDDMWQDTFYARLIVSVEGRWIDIDCRPSDGIAVALRAQAPIYVADEVLESCRLSEE